MLLVSLSKIVVDEIVFKLGEKTAFLSGFVETIHYVCKL
jgi:hypothetical protein